MALHPHYNRGYLYRARDNRGGGEGLGGRREGVKRYGKRGGVKG